MCPRHRQWWTTATEGGPDGTIVETKVWPSLTERLPKQKPGEARGTRLSKQTFWSTPRVGLTGLLSEKVWPSLTERVPKQKPGEARL
jgi:hypothetical protein